MVREGTGRFLPAQAKRAGATRVTPTLTPTSPESRFREAEANGEAELPERPRPKTSGLSIPSLGCPDGWEPEGARALSPGANREKTGAR